MFSASASLSRCSHHQKQAIDTKTATAHNSQISMPLLVPFLNGYPDGTGMGRFSDMGKLHCHPSSSRSAASYEAKSEAETEVENEAQAEADAKFCVAQASA